MDLFDKMEPPRPEMDVKGNSKTYLKNTFFVILSLANMLIWAKMIFSQTSIMDIIADMSQDDFFANKYYGYHKLQNSMLI
jgi:hypothetical protein